MKNFLIIAVLAIVFWYVILRKKVSAIAPAQPTLQPTVPSPVPAQVKKQIETVVNAAPEPILIDPGKVAQQNIDQLMNSGTLSELQMTVFKTAPEIAALREQTLITNSVQGTEAQKNVDASQFKEKYKTVAEATIAFNEATRAYKEAMRVGAPNTMELINYADQLTWYLRDLSTAESSSVLAKVNSIQTQIGNAITNDLVLKINEQQRQEASNAMVQADILASIVNPDIMNSEPQYPAGWIIETGGLSKQLKPSEPIAGKLIDPIVFNSEYNAPPKYPWDTQEFLESTYPSNNGTMVELALDPVVQARLKFNAQALTTSEMMSGLM